jgi:hypothetical protein
VNWFKTAFMQQQSFLDDLPAADRAFVEDVASYAVLQTDMRVSASQDLEGHMCYL